MSDKENSASKKSRFRMARGWVAFACVAFALAGMAFRVGIGTPSACGIQQISAICPLGALETMAGAKGVMLHPLLLFALVVVLIALVGKAFCAWMCPVPWLQKFFRPRKHSAAKGGVGRGAPTKGAAPRRRAGRGMAFRLLATTPVRLPPRWSRRLLARRKLLNSGKNRPPERPPRVRPAQAHRRVRRRSRRLVASATACGWTAATRCWWERWPPRPCLASRCFASSARSV